MAITAVIISLSSTAGAAGMSERAGPRLSAVPSVDYRDSRTSPRSETRRCPDHHAGLRYYRQRHRHWLRKRGAHLSPQRRIAMRPPRSCPDARYLAVVWKTRAARARTVTERFLEQRVLDDFRVCAGCDGWRRAVREVQKVYPNTEGWLMSCASSEGGHGRFVFNSQGSGAAGWLQFMPSTFTRMSFAARVDAASRGFIVPASASSLYSPLGQALAGAWGVTNGRAHEWAGSGCR